MPRFKNLVTKQSKDDEVGQADIDDENTQESDAPTVIDLLDMGLNPNPQATSNPTNVDITDMLIT